jgi:hypothetical protein
MIESENNVQYRRRTHKKRVINIAGCALSTLGTPIVNVRHLIARANLIGCWSHNHQPLILLLKAQICTNMVIMVMSVEYVSEFPASEVIHESIT